MKNSAMNPISRLLSSRRLAWLTPFMAPGLALANPSGGQVVSGNAAITNPDAATVQINQLTRSAAINWQSFSIEQAEYVIFNQPSASAVVLNRVLGGNPSEILGHLLSNGRVFLVNGAGIMFGEGAQVDVGSLVASTLDISNADFEAGRYVFSGDSQAAVTNAGSITSAAGGFVVLAGDQVSNAGVIQAQLGQIVLASGKAITLAMSDSGLVNYAIDSAALSDRAGVSNAGQLIADGGRVVMAAKTAQALARTVVNNTGLVQAQSIVSGKNGEIILSGVGGDVVNSGTLKAAGTAASAAGGSVTLVSDKATRLTSTSNIQTAGAGMLAKGGQLHVSGSAVSVRGIMNIGKGGLFLLDPETVTIVGGNGNDNDDSTVFENDIESLLQAGTDVQVIAWNEINVDDVEDGAINGQANGNGGSLLLGIGYGTETGFSPGAGYAGGGIQLEDTAIYVDGDIDLFGGWDYGFVVAGDLVAGRNIDVQGQQGVELGDILIDGGDDGARLSVYSNGLIETGTIDIVSTGRSSAELWSGNNGGVTIDDVNIQGRGDHGALDHYGASILEVYSGYGDVNTGNITLEALQGWAEVELEAGGDGGYGNVTVDGSIHVTGGGGSMTDANLFQTQHTRGVASVDIQAAGNGPTGNVTVTGDIVVDGNADVFSGSYTDSFDYVNESGYGWAGERTITGNTRFGDASVIINADSDVQLGGVDLSTQGDALLLIQANDITLSRAASVVTTAGSISTDYTHDRTYFASNVEQDSQLRTRDTRGTRGGSIVIFDAGSGSEFGGYIETHGVTVQGPSAGVRMAANFIRMNADGDGQPALTVIADGQNTTVTGSNDGDEFAAYYNGIATAYLSADQQVDGYSIVSNGGITVTGNDAPALLQLYGYGSIFIAGDVTVTGSGNAYGGDNVHPHSTPAAPIFFGDAAGAVAFIHAKDGNIVVGTDDITSDVTVSGSDGPGVAFLVAGNDSSEYSYYGDVRIYGALNVSGGGGDGFNDEISGTPDVAGAFVFAFGGESDGGAVVIRDGINIHGEAVHWSADEGNAEAPNGVGGNALLYVSGDSLIDIGGLDVSSPGDAQVILESWGEVAIGGPINIVSTGSTTRYNGVVISEGDALLNVGSDCLTDGPCYDYAGPASFGPMRVSGGDALVYVQAETVEFSNGGEGNAIDIAATGIEYKDGENSYKAGDANLFVYAYGGTAAGGEEVVTLIEEVDTPSILVDGDVRITALADNSDAYAGLQGYGDIAINGDVFMHDFGSGENAAAALQIYSGFGDIQTGDIFVRSRDADAYAGLLAYAGVATGNVTVISDHQQATLLAVVTGYSGDVTIDGAIDVAGGGGETYANWTPTVAQVTLQGNNVTVRDGIKVRGQAMDWGGGPSSGTGGDASVRVTGPESIEIGGGIDVQAAGDAEVALASYGGIIVDGPIDILSTGKEVFSGPEISANGDATLAVGGSCSTDPFFGVSCSDVAESASLGPIHVTGPDAMVTVYANTIGISNGGSGNAIDIRATGTLTTLVAPPPPPDIVFSEPQAEEEETSVYAGGDARLELVAYGEDESSIEVDGGIREISVDGDAYLTIDSAGSAHVGGDVLVQAMSNEDDYVGNVILWASAGGDTMQQDQVTAISFETEPPVIIDGSFTALAGNDVTNYGGYPSFTNQPFSIAAHGVKLDAGNDVVLQDADVASYDNVGIFAGNDVLLTNTLLQGNRIDVQAEEYIYLNEAALIGANLVFLIAGDEVASGVSTSYISAPGVGVAAGEAIDMDETVFEVGTGHAPFGADPFFTLLLKAGGASEAVPDSAVPNLAFSAPSVDLEAGNIHMTGDHLFLRTDYLDLGEGVADVPNDLVVHFQTWTSNADIHVVDDLDDISVFHSNELYLGRYQHFDRFPGTSFVFGGLTNMGDIIVGQDGVDIAGDNDNFVFITNSFHLTQNDLLDLVDSSGLVRMIHPVLLFNLTEDPSQWELALKNKLKSAEDIATDQESGDESGETQNQTSHGVAKECKS